MEEITAVGIDVSKGKSTIAIMRPGGEVVALPYDVPHTGEALQEFVSFLASVGGNIRIVMEHTSTYYLPIASALINAGFFVSVVHAKLVHDFGNNSIRRGKTDAKDAIKIANYALANWTNLAPSHPQDNIRGELKKLNRQQDLYMRFSTSLKNNLIALHDQVFPGLNKLFNPETKVNGHQKWIDFSLRYWHRDCVACLSRAAFTESYRKWCKKSNSHFNADKVNEIYDHARAQVATLPKNDTIKLIAKQAASQLNAVLETIVALQAEMTRLAKQLPEYETVLAMPGVGKILVTQLMAEIGDVTRFHSKRALTAFAGLDAPPYQSGQFESKERKISKRGSPHLRRSLFRAMTMIWANQMHDDVIFQFMCKKRDEGKHFFVYTNAGANKFLRRYYGQVRDCLMAENEPPSVA